MGEENSGREGKISDVHGEGKKRRRIAESEGTTENTEAEINSVKEGKSGKNWYQIRTLHTRTM
jgi:hypothetical protein